MSLLGDDVNAVLTTLNLNKVVIAVHSAGGIPLVGYIQSYGTSKINGIVITDAIVDNGVFAYIPPSVLGAIAQTAFAPTADAFMAANQVFLSLSSYQPLEPGLNNYLLIQDLLMPQAARQALLGALGSYNLNVMSNVQVKTLIIWGANDAAIQVGAANYLQSIIPHNQKFIFNNTGHMPMIENAGKYNDLVANFVSGLK